MARPFCVLLVAVALAPLARAQNVPADSASVTWLSITPRWSSGGRTAAYDVIAETSGDDAGLWVGSFGVGVRVIDISDVDQTAAGGTPSCCLPAVAVSLDVGRRIGQSPFVARVGGTGWVPPVFGDAFIGGGDLRVEVAFVPKGAGPTLSIGLYVTGARTPNLDLGDRGGTVSLGYRFPIRDRPSR